MAGFDNGTVQSGVYFQAKQFGSIIRGFGPPVSQAGVVGDLYIDTQTWFLYEKRSNDSGGDVDPWGHYLFQVPTIYRTQLKWFNSYAPTDDVGLTGDYCLLWGGYSNYGLQPSIFGPKLVNGAGSSWPENGNGPNVSIASVSAGTVIPIGLTGEGAAINDSSNTQLIVTGLVDEYTLGVPVTATAGQPVMQLGLQSGPINVAVTLNPLYTAEDENPVSASGGAGGTARLPAHAASITILTTDIEVGIDTGTAPTSCVLPSVASWAAASTSGLELDIFDFTGHGLTNNITFVLNGTDVFTQGAAPVIADNYGQVKLRPILTGGINQWFVRGAG